MSEEKKDLLLSAAPHVRSDENVTRIMFAVVYSLAPAVLAAIYFFGPKAIALIGICVGASLATEYIFQTVRKKPVTIADGSIIITGLLLALTLPPDLPLFMAAIGSVVAVALGKQIFGGLGQNVFNPALVGRAFLQAAFPVAMATWAVPLAWLSGKVDAAASATPLNLMKFPPHTTTSVKELFIGNVSGSLGETSAVALLLGAAYLYYKGYIEWRIPATILGSAALFTGALWLVDPSKYPNPLFTVLSGGLIIGAFYMATDYVTSPITPKGKMIFGAGIGILVVIIRVWGGLPEGVMYAILFFNALTPIVNRYTKPRVFGGHNVAAR